MKAGPSDDRSPIVAKASGYQNNCAFHCVALSWLDLPPEKIEALYQAYPVYKQILKKFYEYYQLEEEPDLAQFLKMMQGFKHPYDKEILLGPVLRNVLQEIMVQEKLNPEEIALGKFVPDDRLALLTARMGASLRIHSDLRVGDVIPQEYYQVDDAQWSIEIYHENVHYNFSYESEEKNRWHNKQYYVDTIYNKRLPQKSSTDHALLEDAAEVVGAKEQKAAILQVMRAKYDEIKEQIPRKKASPFSPMASRNVVGFAMDIKPQASLPELIVKVIPDTKAKAAKKSIIESDAFNHAFEQKLKVAFSAEVWKLESTAERIKISSKSSPENKIHVTKISNGMKFSGTKNTQSEVARAANCFKEVCQDNHQKVTFQVSAQNEAQALVFLKNLQDSHFDIRQITAIHCQGTELKGESLESYTQKLIAKIIQPSSGPTLRGGG